ncbi:BGLF3 [Macacine gammaherpesvirus 4]|uniref:BGLF3 n=1 Tax=Macacine gammaherpesvirus 4 TaxID=45455 RepID=Q8UZF8_9GAMA|nr:BGLF3 [Macacine gammaherpesvirus 4]AAK95454.1 BGLF3 [Macacine gammaherpesvirus 4]
MFNAVKADMPDDPMLARRYGQCLELALEACQDTPEQFKLVETPLKSFLLVTNILPQDTRPWQEARDPCQQAGDDYDFSSLALELSPLNPRLPEEWRFGEQGGLTPAEPPQVQKGSGLCFEAYDGDLMRIALTWNKDEVIGQALQILAHSQTWTSLVPEDPLPWLWALFYGPRAHCEERHCVYSAARGRRGPILLPTAIYTPRANIEAFLAHLTRCVYALYADVCDWQGEEIAPPFDVSRLNKMAKQLSLLPQEPVCITRVCLLCLLHKQNLNAQYKRPVDTYDPCLILTGEAERYLVDAVGNYREAATGTTVLYPTYDLGSIVADMVTYEDE